MTKAKPCPFCGGEGKIIVRRGKNGWRDRYSVLCDYDDGGCGSESGWYHYEQEAVEAWNSAMSGATDTNVGDKFAKDINVPNKGKWQRRKGSDCWECSECHAVLESDDIVRHNYYYCYHCGADMMSEDGYMKLEGTEHE